jgi:NADH-quinone oxidoreductase subunit K
VQTVLIDQLSTFSAPDEEKSKVLPLWMYLIVAAGLFCIGAYGVLSRRNAVAILMGVELMLNAVIINLVAFWRYVDPAIMAGQAFAAFVYVVAAAEASVGLAIIISVYRGRRSVVVEDIDLLKW